MKKLIAGAAMAALISSPLAAQAAMAAQQPGSAQAAADGSIVLAANTPITLAVAQEVNSSTHRAGDVFPLTVVNDVMAGGVVIIPRGTQAQAEITWRTGKGAFGKSGKLEFALRHIDLNGQRIPIHGTFRQEGEGNTIATGVGIIAVGVFAGFITGRRARLPVGRELMAQIDQPVPFTADGRLAPSYDWRAAMTAAEANDPVAQCRTQANALTNDREKRRALERCFIERME